MVVLEAARAASATSVGGMRFISNTSTTHYSQPTPLADAWPNAGFYATYCLISVIRAADRQFVLREPITLAAELEDNAWVYEYKSLGLLSSARSPDEARESLASDFAALWDLIAQEHDRNLTTDAQMLKRKLRRLVLRVERIR